MNGSTLVESVMDSDESGLYYTVEPYLAGFYLVDPRRTMQPNIEVAPNFFQMYARVAPTLFLVETALLWLQGLPTYKWNDSVQGFCALVVATLPQATIEFVVFTFYSWIYERYRLVDFAYDSMLTWFLCVLALDLSLYVSHRAGHEVNIIWASHQLHHTSEYYNLFTASRNSFVDKFIILLCVIPWAFVLPPGPAMCHHQLNLVYQFWIHTLAIGNLGPLEYIIVSPTQHTIHHGRNRFCIDKNYGGVLSIWDQLFGTMVWPKHHKGKKIYYGLVHPTRSWDILYCYLHAARDMVKRVGEYSSFGDKLSAIFKGPGWSPGKPRLGNLEDIPETPEDTEPYDKPSPVSIYAYCMAHVIIVYMMNNHIVSHFNTMPAYIQFINFSFSLWSVINIGYMLEHKWYAPATEWTRCAMFFVVEWMIGSVLTSFGIAVLVVKLWYAFCLAAWSFNLRYFANADEDDEQNKLKAE